MRVSNNINSSEVVDAAGSDRRSAVARGWPCVDPVALVVETASATSVPQPVSVGIPFPRGALGYEGAVALSDPDGGARSSQATALARWPDGSVKWLLLDFLLPPTDAGRTVWTLNWHSGDRAPVCQPDGRLGVEEHGGAIVVSTGTASFRLDPQTLAPIASVEIDGTSILGATSVQALLRDRRGRIRRPRIERSQIEARGPARATVCFDGAFEGGRGECCRFRARLSFFAGSSSVRLEFTLHNPRRARHTGGLWDLGDPGSIYFRDFTLGIDLAESGRHRVRWTEDVEGSEQTTEVEAFEIYQESSGGENWRSRNHVNRHGQVPCRFRGYRVCRGADTTYGLRASPVVSVQTPGGTITAAIPEFWQQFPKAVDIREGALNVRVFPDQFGDHFELQAGEQKTHTVWLHFSGGDRSEIDALRWVHRPAQIQCTPDWYASAGTVPHLSPAPADDGERYETYLAELLSGPKSLFARREIIDEYGWRNYGEVYADHEAEHYKGDPPVISHYNNQYDFLNGTLLQWMRSGDTRWLELAGPLARHILDIDIYHTDKDKSAYNQGMFWHTNHYRDAATCTHRAYSRQNSAPGDPFGGGGPSSNHNYSTGLLHYYYLTGDANARDVVLGLADWVVNMDDGEKTVFAILDRSPTGNATYPGESNYQGPCRGAGNSINALIDGWLLTSHGAYLAKAEQLICRVSHPDDDVPGRNLLNVEPRWSYTVFLSAVARYLAVKAEAGELDFMHAYARAVLLHYACWMVDHERPYFDQVENLEFPNETWAAQEFRKANVLRLAAAHADEPLRSAALARGDELAERAWRDLSQFASKHSARAAALLLTEGARDAFFARTKAAAAPRADARHDFGRPQQFIPQKERVIAQLQSPASVLDALVKLMAPGNWRRIRLRGYIYWNGLRGR